MKPRIFAIVPVIAFYGGIALCQENQYVQKKTLKMLGGFRKTLYLCTTLQMT